MKAADRLWQLRELLEVPISLYEQGEERHLLDFVSTETFLEVMRVLS